jgi:hypothetical protein
MPRFMDFHQDLKLPAEAIAQIAEDTRNGTADEFGVRQVELYTTPTARCTACWTDPTRTPSASTTPRSASPARTCTRSTASPDRGPYRPGPASARAGMVLA